jgi:hypothetical protein
VEVDEAVDSEAALAAVEVAADLVASAEVGLVEVDPVVAGNLKV